RRSDDDDRDAIRRAPGPGGKDRAGVPGTDAGVTRVVRPRAPNHARGEHARRHLLRALPGLYAPRRGLPTHRCRRERLHRLSQQLHVARAWTRPARDRRRARRRAARGTVHGAPVEAEVALAEEIIRRVPSVEQLRFTNSGTEAVLGAIRAARAYTGRAKVLKMEGGYHGSYDAAEVSVDPGADPPMWPEGRPDGAGLSPGLTGEVLVAPFNDLSAVRSLVTRHRR